MSAEDWKALGEVLTGIGLVLFASLILGALYYLW